MPDQADRDRALTRDREERGQIIIDIGQLYTEIQEVKRSLLQLQGSLQTYVAVQDKAGDHVTGSFDQVNVWMEKMDMRFDRLDERLSKTERRVVAWPASAVVATAAIVYAVVTGGGI